MRVLGMWIRSQSRKALLNVNQVVIIPSVDKRMYFICNSLEKESVTLGVYSTLEKAFKVLNEIRNELNDAQYYEIENKGHGMYTLNTGIRVYRMPDDEDVEV